MNRRWFWAVRAANTSMRARVTMSTHGDSVSKGSGSSASWRISSAQIICVHVVPHFGGVLMMTSPRRNSKPCQRLLSYMVAWYRRTAAILAGGSLPVTARTWTSRGVAVEEVDDLPEVLAHHDVDGELDDLFTATASLLLVRWSVLGSDLRSR